MLSALLAHIRNGRVLKKYDFVDVIKTESKCGWQVKATKAGTPVTWKRAKIPKRQELISASRKSEDGLQALGNTRTGSAALNTVTALVKPALPAVPVVAIWRKESETEMVKHFIAAARQDF